MLKISPNSNKKPVTFSKKLTVTINADANALHHLAFENSSQPNIISIVRNGKIIIVNSAACRLLGYSANELLTKKRSAIFDIKENNFKNMLMQRMAEGHSTALVTAIKKSGEHFSCEITSAIFMDTDGIEKAITTIADMSQSILNQKNIDTINEKIVAHNIVLAKSKQKDIDIINEKIVADNIVLAKSKQKGIDIINEKIVADNIVLAKSKQKDIDIINEKIVADNIVLAKSKQKNIDIINKKIVADNIILAQEICDTRLEQEINLKEKQIAEARYQAREMERSDIGKELHDNVNQLLGASRLYLTMSMKGGINSKMYVSRSSEYTLSAIEEIRKLTKRLTTDVIKTLGLCESIDNVVRDTMEVNPVEISCTLESFKEDSVNHKFKLNVFRIVQEELNNILKHAKATEVIIKLLQNKKSITLSISDNGVGFDTQKKHKGIGIRNINSRAVAFNGTADFISKPGKGCVLTVTFPVTNALLTKT